MEWVKQYALYIAMAAGIMVGAVGVWWLSPQQKQDDASEVVDDWLLETQDTGEELDIPQEDGELNSVMIDIKGEVKHPGVYELNNGKRIVDAIQIAGGFLDEADQQKVNLAQKLTDEMVIYISKIGDESAPLPSSLNEEKEGKINLNQATVDQLDTLPGIGPSKAEDILAYREEKGSFQTIEDLKEISGIGEKTFEKLKELIMVD